MLQHDLLMYSYESTGIKIDRYTKAVVALLRRFLRDKVHSVYVKASQTLTILVSDFFNKHRISKKEIGITFEKILPDLFAKTADNSSRAQNLAVASIQEILSISFQREIWGIGKELTRPLTQAIHPRSAVCRATIVEVQLKQLKLSSLPKDRESGFTLRQLIDFGLSALQHQNSEARKCGERLLVTLYHQYPVAIRRALPVEAEPARKNVLFRNLFEQFEELDFKQIISRSRSMATTPYQSSSQIHHFEEFARHIPGSIYRHNLTSTPDGSSTSSGFSTASSAAFGDRYGNPLPTICVTPDEAESRGKAITRLNSSQFELREEDEEAKKSTFLISSEIEERTCIFCGQYNEEFIGTGLDLHYWKSCPMLMRCMYCKKVIEISGLSGHLLDDCDSVREFRRCERCTEAIPIFEYKRHVSTATCIAAKPAPLANHCPLCHSNIPPWDGGWRYHLTPGPNCCVANSRIRPSGARKSQSQTFEFIPKQMHLTGKLDERQKSCEASKSKSNARMTSSLYHTKSSTTNESNISTNLQLSIKFRR